MGKIDCNIINNYFKEKARMTNNCEIGCKNCVLSSYNNGFGRNCSKYELLHTNEAIQKVQEWSDEHPIPPYIKYFERVFSKKY